MTKKIQEETPEVPAEEAVKTPVEKPVCPNCNNSGLFCSVCSDRVVVK